MIDKHLDMIQKEFAELEQKLKHQQGLETIVSIDTLPDKVRQVRKKQGLTLQGLSELSGVSYSTLTKLEAGEEGISLRLLKAVVSTLGLKLWVG